MPTLRNKGQCSFPLYKVRMTCHDLHCLYYSLEVMEKLIGWNITWRRCRQYRYQIIMAKLEQNPDYSGCTPISPSDFPILLLNQPSLKPEITLTIAGVPGEKPWVASDKLPDSPSKFPFIQLWMTRRIWHCIKSHLRPYSTHPFNWEQSRQYLWRILTVSLVCKCSAFYHSCALIFLPSYRGFLELVTAFQHHCLLCWRQLLLKHWILWSKNQVIQN